MAWKLILDSDVTTLTFKGEFKTSTSSPITLGHEFSGKIVALGDLAKEHFMIGDKVAVDPNRYI